MRLNPLFLATVLLVVPAGQASGQNLLEQLLPTRRISVTIRNESDVRAAIFSRLAEIAAVEPGATRRVSVPPGRVSLTADFPNGRRIMLNIPMQEDFSWVLPADYRRKITDFRGNQILQYPPPGVQPDAGPKDLEADDFYRYNGQERGLAIKAPMEVWPESMQEAHRWVRRMFSGCPAVAERLSKAEVCVIVFSRYHRLTDVPELRKFRDKKTLAGAAYDQHQGFILEGKYVVVSEASLVLSRGAGQQESHLLLLGLARSVYQLGLSKEDHDKLTLCYQNARQLGLWKNTQAETNKEDYFTELVQVYFGMAYGKRLGGTNGSVALRDRDPRAYQLIDDVFNPSLPPAIGDTKSIEETSP